MKKKLLSIFIALVLALSLCLVTAGPVLANDVPSSTMIFEGTLTDVGDGVYTGTIPMTAGAYYTNGGFDVYAKEGGTAYVEGMDPDSWTIGDDHDAYSESGPWGSWYDPDCADWNQYSLELTADHWYLRYTATGESPMSGVMDWTAMYASETDKGTDDTTADETDPVNYPYAAGSAQEWGWNCGWGEERIPLEFLGFAVEITEDEGVYTVTLTPAPPTKADVLRFRGSGVPGKGLENAPGQQKPFNPKSQAAEHAGKKGK